MALAPLLERFEADHGTLLTAAMFVGRMYTFKCPNELPSVNHLSPALSTLPAAAYLLVERGLLRGNTAVMGARCERKGYLGRAGETVDNFTKIFYSVWVFVLLGAEGIKAFKANPYFACAHLHPSLRLLRLTGKCKYWYKSDTNVDHSTPGTHLCHGTRT